MKDIRQSLNYAKYLSSLGWTVERLGEINYFIKKFPFIGSILKVQRPSKIDFEIIDKLCRKYRVFQIILEPNLASSSVSTVHRPIIDQGFKLSISPFLPSKTLQLDLTLSMNQLISSMKKDARQAIRKGSDQLIKVYSFPSDIRKWREAWKNSVKFDRYVPSTRQLINLRKSFPDNYSAFLASHNGSTSSPQVISGAVFLSSGNIAYYWQAFTNSEGRASLSQYSLLYQGILWAKKMGCKIFDFEGIYDPRFPNKSWLGFTHFKRSFGGYEIEYPGCYTKFRLPI